MSCLLYNNKKEEKNSNWRYIENEKSIKLFVEENIKKNWIKEKSKKKSVSEKKKNLNVKKNYFFGEKSIKISFHCPLKNHTTYLCNLKQVGSVVHLCRCRGYIKRRVKMKNNQCLMHCVCILDVSRQRIKFLNIRNVIKIERKKGNSTCSLDLPLIFQSS